MPKQHPGSDRHRALALLAASRDGGSEALLVAHGVTIDQMVELVRAGLATAEPERVMAGRHVIEVARVIDLSTKMRRSIVRSVVGRLASTPSATVASRRVCVASSPNRRRAWREIRRGEGGRRRGSGLNCCLAFYTTTNVSRRRRRAVGLPPRQRSWAAWEALGQLPSALHRAASAARSCHRGTRARHDWCE